MTSQRTEQADDSTESKQIGEMDADEFHENFDWDSMRDGAIAWKCHSWIQENEHVISVDGKVMTYDEGVWEENEGRVAQILQTLVRERYQDNVKREYLKGYVHAHDEYRVEQEELGISGSRVAVENGLLDLVDGEIVRELKPDDYAITRLPVKWDGPDAPAPQWETFISQSVAVGDQVTIQEYSGFCLHTNEYPFKKALMLLGGGNNGKGIYENVMTELLGGDNVMNDDLSDLGNQFGLQRLRHKAANINSDIRGNVIQDTSMLKKLTGRDRIRVEPKYQTAFEIMNPAKLVFAANSIPKVNNAERAFYERWLFVQFPNQFTLDENDQYPNATLNLDKQIVEDELPGVLAWAVKGYQRLREQNGFTSGQNADDIRHQWNDYQDTTATFVRNYVMRGDPRVDDNCDHRIRVDEMFDYYEKFIRTTPTAAKSKRELNQYITASHAFPGAKTVASRRAVKDNEDMENVRVWDGVYIPLELREELRERFTQGT